MGRLLFFLLSPDGALTVFAAGAIWIWWRPRSAVARRVVLITALAYAVAGTYVVPAALTRVWTRNYRPFVTADTTKRPTAVVLLAGGEEQITGWADRLPLMNEIETERVLEAWRVYKLVSPDWIVSSGGPPSADHSAEPSSIVMRDALVRLGVPESRILLESSSRDTHDEAVLIAPMLRSRGVEQIVLVTSAVHMPRSIGTFLAAGLIAKPAIAPDPGWTKPWQERWLPTGGGLYFSSSLAHEIMGVPFYWARGWWRN